MDEMAATLWRRWRSRRDEVAFERLVRPELASLYDSARRLGLGRADAEDVVQEALTELAQEPSGRPGAVGVGAWLMRAVRLKSTVRHRAARRRRRHESRSAQLSGAVQAKDPGEVHEVVERALDRLENADRQILLFRFLYDLEYREISYVLGVSQNACRIRVHRASQRLKTHLGERAPALLAVIPLIDFPGTVDALAAVTGAHAAAGAGLAATGGLIMTTGMKMAAAAGFAALLTASAFHFSGRATGEHSPSGESVLAVAADEERADVATLAGRASSPEGLASIEPTEDELTWLSQVLLKERERRSAARITPADGGLDILRRVLKHDLDPWPLLADFERFQSHVRTGAGPTHIVRATSELTPVDLSKLAKGVTVVEFGPGTFQVKGFRGLGGGGGREPLDQLEIRGAGKDETILLMGPYEELMVLAPYRNVRIHDLTMDWANQRSLLDVRNAIAVIFERVQFREWGGALMRVMGKAYVGCQDCEFVNADGRGGSNAMSFRGPGIAILERCTFMGIESVVIGSRNAKGSAVRFADCVFEESRLADNRIVDIEKRPFIDMRIHGSRVTYGNPQWNQETRSERWGAAFASEVRGLDLSASETKMTLGELITILRNLSLPKGLHLYAVRAAGWKDGQLNALTISTWQEGKKRPPVYTYLLDARGAWTLRHEPRGGGYGAQPWKQGRPLDLLVLLERSDLPPSTPVRHARYASMQQRVEGTAPARELDTLQLSDGYSRTWILDATSGAILHGSR